DAVALVGAHAAQCQGVIAGVAAASALGHAVPPSVDAERAKARSGLARHQAFQRALWRLFDAPLLRTQLASPETVLCRCESVTLAAMSAAIRDGAVSTGAVKRR